MKLRSLLVLFSVVTPPLYAQKAGLTPEAVYSKCKPSVVTIMTFDANRAPLAQGSGFVVAKNRIVTNYHVVAGSTSASVIFDDGSMAVVTAVNAGSEPKDLVIVEAETGSRPILGLGDELQLKVGETIYVIGAPKGLSASLSSGLVSGFRQDQGQFLVQITAAIAPGSSGGPLLDTQGLVVGVTTSQLKDGSFGFAMGVGDLKHLLKVPLGIKVQLSDLAPETQSAPGADELQPVQKLYDQKKYDAALASFNALPDPTKSSFEGQLLLCQIAEDKKDYEAAIAACDAAIRAQPDKGEAYGYRALPLLMMGNTERAEDSASKAVKLSNVAYFKSLLAFIHYYEEKFDLVPKELPATSDDVFTLSLLAGASLYNHDYNSFHQYRDKITSIKGDKNGWALYTAGVSAEKELNWDSAIEKYKSCEDDPDFVDSICLISAISAELRAINYKAAKTDMDSAVSRYPGSRRVLREAVFVNLLFGNMVEAEKLHQALKDTPLGIDANTECLYYYGRNQPLLATGYCETSVREDPNSYATWSNAGYAALDSGDFQSAYSRFAKAVQLFGASKDKHTVTQELDVYWGSLVAEYFTGDKKNAKQLYRELKKDYPQFVATATLKQLPLVWSDGTIKLIDKVAADFK